MKHITEFQKTIGNTGIELSFNDLEQLFDITEYSLVFLDPKGFILSSTKKKKTPIEVYFEDHEGQNIIDNEIFSSKMHKKLTTFLQDHSQHHFLLSNDEVIVESGIKTSGNWICWRNLEQDKTVGYMLCFFKQQGTIDNTSIEESNEALIKQKAMDRSINAIALTDDSGIITYVNDSLLDLYGYKKDELIHAPIVNLWKNKASYILVLDTLMHEGSWKGELMAERKDKSIFYAQLCATSITTDDDKTLAMMASFIDITEQKNKEEKIKQRTLELEKSREEYKQLIDGMNDSVLVIDFNGKIIECNDRASKLLGYSRDELLSMRPVDIDANLKSKEINNLIERMKDEKVLIFETEHKTKNKKIFPVEISNSLADYHGDNVIVSVARDITEQKQAKKELIKSKIEAEHILNAAADGVRIVGTDFKVKRMNQTMAEMAGVSIEKGIGMDCQEMFGVKGVCKTKKCRLERVLKNKKTIQMEDTRVNIQGKEIPCMSISHPYIDDKGKIIGMIEDFRDISYFKFAEQKILESERMKTEFMNMAAHELKTPLIPIRGYLEMIEKNMDLEEKQKNWISICLRNVENLSSLIQEVLDVARLESNSMKLNFESVNISQIIRDMEVDLELSFKEKNLDLIIHVPKKDVFVHADEQRMKQVVRNFFSNALKYTQEGSVIVTLQEKMGNVAFSVKDTGIGLSKEDKQKLFKKFSRIESIETRKIKGTGLGLHITKKVVELHNGSVKVESEGRGKGSTFTVTLPLLKKK